MKYSNKSKKQIKQYSDYIKKKREHLYDDYPERKPHPYKNHNDAIKGIKKQAFKLRQAKQIEKQTKGKPDLNHNEIARAIVDSKIPIVLIPSVSGSGNLVFYNYDLEIYEPIAKEFSIFNDYIKAANNNALVYDSVKKLIEAELMSKEFREEYAIYNPPQSYEIPVGNGIFNKLTNELEPYHPHITVTNRIETNYIKNAKHPHFHDGLKFEKLIYDLCDGNEDRIQLFHQIIQQIVINLKKTTTMFIVKGIGGSGKSLLFDIIANMIGNNNVGRVAFDEFNDDDVLLEVFNKRMAYGEDNDRSVYLKKTGQLKRMISKQNLTLKRKYLSTITVKSEPTVVQLTNSLPRFGEQGLEIKRRTIVLNADHNLITKSKAVKSFEEKVDNKRLHEYVLSYILDDQKIPYYNTFNDVDNYLLEDSINDEDYVFQFVEDMLSLGLISPQNTKIASNILFAAYRDWHKENVESSKALSKKTFNTRIKPLMQQIGYEFNSDLNETKSRLSKFISDGDFQYENIININDTNNDQFAQELQHKTRPTNFFMLTGDFDSASKRLKRNVHEISIISFFSLEDQFVHLFGDDLDEDLLKNYSEFKEVSIDNNLVPNNPQQLELTKQNVKSANDEQLHELLATATAVASKEQSNIAVRHFLDDINMRSVSNDELREELLDFISELNNK